MRLTSSGKNHEEVSMTVQQRQAIVAKAVSRYQRSRKNDSCFVEQQNYSNRARAVGYARYDTEEQCQSQSTLSAIRERGFFRYSYRRVTRGSTFIALRAGT